MHCSSHLPIVTQGLFVFLGLQSCFYLFLSKVRVFYRSSLFGLEPQMNMTDYPFMEFFIFGNAPRSATKLPSVSMKTQTVLCRKPLSVYSYSPL